MESTIQTFTSNEFGSLEVLQEGDKFYFPAIACAVILGYSNPRDAVLRHCKGVVKRDLLTEGGVQEVKYISEGDLYRLIIRSKLESSRKFETWVFDEVLPSIRKHGAYINPVLLEKLKTSEAECHNLYDALSKEMEKRQMLAEKCDCISAELEEAKPKLNYYDVILKNPTAVPITLIAKDYGASARAFNAFLYKCRIQYPVGGTWCLYQDYADKGYTHTGVTVMPHGHIVSQTHWTQKGRLFLYNFLGEIGIVPQIEKKGA